MMKLSEDRCWHLVRKPESNCVDCALEKIDSLTIRVKELEEALERARRVNERKE